MKTGGTTIIDIPFLLSLSLSSSRSVILCRSYSTESPIRVNAVKRPLVCNRSIPIFLSRLLKLIEHLVARIF